ncbi:cache domain-containing sensor histidine kinase [Paenibacillus xanthanilyticus]|uniref:Sensor histidine kinase n=1 Tax=Paenibacillus xanthanilyticus TaxID=1783531 RepID=A0ABV8K973_9BACL
MNKSPKVKGWLTRFRFRKLRTRIFAMMIALSLPPLFILGYVSFNISKETLTETNSNVYRDHLQTSSEVADLLFRNITSLSRSLVLNEDVRKDLMDSSLNAVRNEAEVRARTINRLKSIINHNLLDLRHIDSVCLLDIAFTPYCIGRSDNAGIYEGEQKHQAIEQSDWYKKTVAAQGRVIFYGHNVLEPAKKSFSTIKLFRNSETAAGEAIGVLIININKTIFDNIFSESDNSGEFLVLNDSRSPMESVFARKGIHTEAYENESGFAQSLKDEGYLVSRYRNPTTHWVFVHTVQEKTLLKQSNRIGTATTVIASTIAFVALLISYIVSGGITRPLLRLKKMMVEWTKGNRNFEETFGPDEVGVIGETFKRVAAENEELVERLLRSELKEREAELRALQAQIKPHFLYNTLDSIYWMAAIQNNQEIARMAVALSESFKLSLNKGREEIPVYKELKHIEHYMTIQNIRFKDRFAYIEEVDPAIKSVEIMKLLLQPLVENSIYHGLEKKVGKGTIRLTGMREGEFIQFIVEDDGVGIADMSALERGYGLRNVRERLHLFYGPSSYFEVFSEVNKGTRIVIRFRPQPIREDKHA